MYQEVIELLKDYLSLSCAVFIDDDIELHRNLRNRARKLIPALENQIKQEEKKNAKSH